MKANSLSQKLSKFCFLEFFRCKCISFFNFLFFSRDLLQFENIPLALFLPRKTSPSGCWQQKDKSRTVISQLFSLIKKQKYFYHLRCIAFLVSLLGALFLSKLTSTRVYIYIYIYLLTYPIHTQYQPCQTRSCDLMLTVLRVKIWVYMQRSKKDLLLYVEE